ncbi:DHA1 family bicyclomycin/chloramphenicol resistance-like MFS transporter [Polymorphobacter multimanifer]|uniref:Bcr/CflA family efflux transporter n=1 Tax=Polymorphobacter multimanifer TaxID=1070431 RepID=A0A841LD62_9SPHN|nr:multidrug effflux MFS transporter [Polymorphobacter multimanifer]MBB6227755.1 DHA1 family bicyclomycin/chloramphenicol resistance-like MFS transporter [Polymorphobacter multimanifer]
MPMPQCIMEIAAPSSRQPTRGELLLLGALTAFGAMTIDLYLPTLPVIARDFGATPAAVQLTFTAFFIGMAAGQLVYGPVSDRMGRRPAILFGCVLYVVASLACAFAPTIEWLVAGRFVQALGCCAGMVVARAVVRDRYDHRDSARIFSLLVLVLAVAPMIAPSVGGWLAAVVSWRAVFVALALFGGCILAAVFWRLDESRSAATEAKARGEKWWESYADLFRHRRLMGYVLVGAANGATLFGYIATAPDLVIDVWGFTSGQFSMIFAFIAFGVIGSSQVNRALLKRHSPDAVLAVAVLVAALFGLGVLGLALAGAGHWWMIGAFFAVLTSNGFIAANALAGALNVDPLRAGATSGLYGAGNFAVGAVASAVAAVLHDGTALPVSLVMAVALIGAALAYYGLARPR